MQWLADTGTRMEEAFCQSPVCSPARACFHTGRIASRHGIHDWLREHEEPLQHPCLKGQKSLAGFLKEAGYRTGLVGKWHCGHSGQPPPGWDTWFTSALGTNARFGEQVYYEGTSKQTFHGHQETILTDRALRFLREDLSTAEAEPFFLFVGYTNTHTPHRGEAPPVVDHYRKADFRDIPDECDEGRHGHARIAPFDPREPERREHLAQYYAAVEIIDQQMNRLVSELENLGQLDNTLLVYTSDHGHLNGHHGLHTKGNATVPVNFLEESIRIPLLARWPDFIRAGHTLSFPVDHSDLFATLLDVAGVDAPAATRAVTSPGRSFLPQLGGQPEDPSWRKYQICEYAYSRMIRTPSAKLIRRFPTKVTSFPDEFYDLASDPRENRNVIDEPAHASVIRDLDRILEDHFRRYEDPARAGTNMKTIHWHNPGNPWEILPGEDTHRQ